MSVIEGGGFRCDVHEFTTNSIDEWNSHCFGNPEHTESGTTACTNCGTKLEFTGLPFHKLKADGSKGIALKCPDCEQQSQGQVKRTVVQ